MSMSGQREVDYLCKKIRNHFTRKGSSIPNPSGGPPESLPGADPGAAGKSAEETIGDILEGEDRAEMASSRVELAPEEEDTEGDDYDVREGGSPWEGKRGQIFLV